MDNFKTFFKNGNYCANAEMLSFQDKTQKPRAILAPTISVPYGIQ